MSDQSASGRLLQIRSGLGRALKRSSGQASAVTFQSGRVRAERLPALLRSAVDVVAPVASIAGKSILAKTFLLLVLMPTIAAFLYFTIWQSNGYVSETRLTVRAAQEQRGSITDTSSIIGKLSNSNPRTTVQDSYIVQNYIKSSAILEDIGGRSYLKKYFSGSHIDYFSRLDPDVAAEELVKYWLKRVFMTVDTVSGILTVKVEAFHVEDARKIASDIVQLSERFVNTMTVRSRSDALERARQEVDLAADKLAAARKTLTDFRDRSAMIDPGSRAQSIGELIGKLTMDKISIENMMATMQGTLGPDSPTQRVQRTKLSVINQQIDELKKSLTDSKSDSAVSSLIASFERLKLDEQFNERMYTISQSSYDRARQELERQQLYLAVIVPPALPESATYPKTTASTILLFAMLFVLWAIGALIAASVNDQMA